MPDNDHADSLANHADFLDLDALDDLDDLDTEVKLVQDNDMVEFALKSLLTLYARGKSSDLYANYYEGFKLLLAWLRPISIPGKAERPDLYVDIPRYISSWETQEIARIIECQQSVVWHLFVEIWKESVKGVYENASDREG